MLDNRVGGQVQSREQSLSIYMKIASAHMAQKSAGGAGGAGREWQRKCQREMRTTTWGGGRVGGLYGYGKLQCNFRNSEGSGWTVQGRTGSRMELRLNEMQAAAHEFNYQGEQGASESCLRVMFVSLLLLLWLLLLLLLLLSLLAAMLINFITTNCY